MARSPRLFTSPAGEPKLAREDRRALGAYYTPPEIARLAVELALAPYRNGPAPRVLDPACGAGEFLVAAGEHLADRYGDSAAAKALFGIDVDPGAVAVSRARLKQRSPLYDEHQIVQGDGLDEQFFLAESFDAIVGNPPYVSIRQLAKNLPRDEIDNLRVRYKTARGNFDLYVVFLERALALLRSGGRCALVIPNKWATLDYARPCRELLLAETTIEQVVDFSGFRPFAAASVYPQLLVFRKGPAPARHCLLVRPFVESKAERIAQRRLAAAAIHLAQPLDVESRVTTQPLGQVAGLACGTPGYAAARIAERLIEADTASLAGSQEPRADFITSGNIDRYRVLLGDVRYLKRDYRRPQLPLDIAEVSPARRSLFAEPKIVIAGMSRRLEAAWDDGGLALGVQVFAARGIAVDPFYLLALLNSKLLTYLFATRYAAKRLGGGYLAINKGQLARLPIRVITTAHRHDSRRSMRLAELAAQASGSNLAGQVAHETEIDRLVYRLYQLTDCEIACVEGHVAKPQRAAA